MVRCKHATLLRLRQEEDSSVMIECDGEMNMKQGSVRRVSRAHYGGYWNRIRLQSNCEKLRTMTQVQSRYRYAQRTLSARRLHRDERRHWTPPLATKSLDLRVLPPDWLPGSPISQRQRIPRRQTTSLVFLLCVHIRWKEISHFSVSAVLYLSHAYAHATCCAKEALELTRRQKALVLGGAARN